MENRMQPDVQRLVTKQEAVRVGNLVVIAQPDQERFSRQEQGLRTRGYQVSETAHFVVGRKPSSPHFVLLHRFEQTTIDADLICVVEQELSRFSFISSAREFGATLFAILASTFPSPRDQQAIWRRFCVNSFEKLRDQVAHPLPALHAVSYIAPFAAIYRRIFELHPAQSLLDVGCSFGFFPVLAAEQMPNARIVGCDISQEALRFSTDLACAYGIRRITFTQQDVLDESLGKLGPFDTVTALHVLEHLAEAQLPLAFRHLLDVTRHRLIIAVPYEEEATRAYGHEQVFTREKLERWGQWCVEAIGGAARYWCEEVAGGLLVIDRL
jgi:2-polyprenyl-3-methyl-5-hydroxy-6-metoxy-1,4-benzoquinol methylase